MAALSEEEEEEEMAERTEEPTADVTVVAVDNALKRKMTNLVTMLWLSLRCRRSVDQFIHRSVGRKILLSSFAAY